MAKMYFDEDADLDLLVVGGFGWVDRLVGIEQG